MKIEMPEPPSLSLLTYNAKTKSPEGLQSLTTPAKVMTQWHDSSFKDEFREFLKEQKDKFPLDLPPRSVAKAEDADSNNPKPAKRQRTGPGAAAGGQASADAAIREEDLVDVDALGLPLTHEANLPSNAKLQIVVTVGNGCYLLNKSGDAQSVKGGAVIAGFYKGKFECHKEMPEGAAIVPFQLKGSEDLVVFNGKQVKLLEVIKQKRLSNPNDAHIGFHEMQDEPTATSPAAFRLSLKPKVFLAFHATPFPVKNEGAEGQPVVIPSVHLAGALPAKMWDQCRYASMTWAVKFPPVGSKGLQPIRPMVCADDCLVVPAGKALKLLSPET